MEPYKIKRYDHFYIILGIILAVLIFLNFNQCDGNSEINIKPAIKSIKKHERKITDLQTKKSKVMLDMSDLNKEREKALEQAKNNTADDWAKYLSKQIGKKVVAKNDSITLSKISVDTIGKKLIACDFVMKENTELKSVIKIQDTIISEHDSIDKENVLIQNALSNELKSERGKNKKAFLKGAAFGIIATIITKLVLGVVNK